jgi:hypothetical protein
VAWRIFYRDRTTFDSDDGAWGDAPPEGVIAVSYRVGDRHVVLSGEENYQLDEETGEIVTHDDRTLIAMIGRYPMTPVKKGHTVATSTFERLMRWVRQVEGL